MQLIIGTKMQQRLEQRSSLVYISYHEKGGNLNTSLHRMIITQLTFIIPYLNYKLHNAKINLTIGIQYMLNFGGSFQSPIYASERLKFLFTNIIADYRRTYTVYAQNQKHNQHKSNSSINRIKKHFVSLAVRTLSHLHSLSYPDITFSITTVLLLDFYLSMA